MEPKSSLPSSQEPITDHHTEPHEFSTHHHIHFPSDPF